MWKRTLENHFAALQEVPTKDLGNDPAAWLEKRVVEHKHDLRWLLAHADDGVIWGRVDNGKLVTAHAHGFGPELGRATLQQARLFGEQGELLLWRDGFGELHARLIVDTPDERRARWKQCFDEKQMLWGQFFDPAQRCWQVKFDALDGGFRVYRHGAEGLRHAVPHDPVQPPPAGKAPRLKVRHYLKQDGFARVEVSRLVDVVYV